MNDMTGTLRSFRGRGLARLAKLCQLEWAARNGIVSVVTENDETNAPMLAVNTRLGYRRFHEVSSYVRDLA
jgi:RimJ/RimL family protein N-acetyltransferase